MTKHYFGPQILFKGNKTKPPVASWLRCKVCGTQVTMQGKGNFIYRASARDEWSSIDPECNPRFNQMRDYLVELSDKAKLSSNSPLENFISHLSTREEKTKLIENYFRVNNYIAPPPPKDPHEVGRMELSILIFVCTVFLSIISQ